MLAGLGNYMMHEYLPIPSCFRKGNANTLVPQWSQNINGIPLLILGDLLTHYYHGW